MRNKGAILLFTVLLAAACVYYLGFTWKANEIDKEAEAYAQNYISKKSVLDSAKAAVSNPSMLQTYLDSLSNAKANFYRDSIKKKVVLDFGLISYTYEDVASKKLALGLDLKGGMNVTLEVSVIDIIKGLSNNSNDPSFNIALEKANSLQATSSKDFVTIFGEEYSKANPNGKLAINFQTIELKGKIDFNTSNEDVLKFLRDHVEEAVTTSQNTLRARIDKFGFTQPNIQRIPGSNRILIELPGVTDKARVRKIVQGTANLEFWETYDNQEINPLLDKANTRLKEIFNPSDSTKTDSLTSKKSDSTLTKVVTDSGSVKTDSTSLLSKLKGTDTSKSALKVGTTKADSAAKLRKDNPLWSLLQPSIKYNNENKPIGYGEGPVVGMALIKDTALLNSYFNNPKIKAIFPKQLKLLWTFKGVDKEETTLQLIALKVTNRDGTAALSGDIISDARTEASRDGGGYEVLLYMKAEAAQVWKKLTREASQQNPKKSIAIVLDNSVYSFPTVQNEIDISSATSITGNFKSREADDLVKILKAGKLPAPSRIVEEEVVGATLGEEAKYNGIVSTVAALILVLIFMGLYYSKAGWVADFAMLINNLFVIGILASFSAVLTLPGIAGIVLTIAMSVDANILIFERVREELLAGKAIGLSIKEGYRHAMPSVIDSHVTGLLLGIILFTFGTGPIQGFATTLIIGTISSMFCAIFITRIIFDRWLGKNKSISFGNKFTEKMFRNININFVKKRKVYYAISTLVIIGGIVAYVAKGGFTLGVDFKGGRSYIVRFDEEKSTEDIRKALAVPFESEPEVKTYGAAVQKRITTTYLISDNTEDAEAKVEAKLHEGLDKLGTKYKIMRSQKVGETVSKDIQEKSIWAVLLSCLVMFIFIFIRFKKWQYGIGAVVALFHDVAIVLSVYVMLDGLLPFSLEITQDFIAAILTVMSYSMTDTVVVFDRIREYLTEKNKSDIEGEEKIKVINFALNSTLSRTINTSLTIFFVLLAIFIFGGETIRGFTFALLIGIVIGTYSSLCIATPIVIDLDRKKKPESDKKTKAKPELQNA